MGQKNRAFLVVLFFVSFLAMTPSEVCCSRSIGLAAITVIEHTRDRLLNDVAVERSSNTAKSPPFDPSSESKRRVRGGSDPIHNRS